MEDTYPSQNQNCGYPTSTLSTTRQVDGVGTSIYLPPVKGESQPAHEIPTLQDVGDEITPFDDDLDKCLLIPNSGLDPDLDLDAMVAKNQSAPSSACHDSNHFTGK